MFFEQDSIVFQILDVLYLEQEETKSYNHSRNFDALSFRLEADTLLSANGKEIEACSNSLCYFPSNVDYKRISKKDKMIVVHFKTFNYHSNDIECFVPEDPSKYARLFSGLYDCWSKKDTSYKHGAAAILNNIFFELYKDNKPEDNLRLKIYPSVTYIKENCMREDFSLSEAAAKSAVSEPYFRKLFKKEYGISPKQYVINRRLRHAASMIVAGYYSLEEISRMCGYCDYKHFSTEFKKLMGTSPSRYKYEFILQSNHMQ